MTIVRSADTPAILPVTEYMLLALFFVLPFVLYLKYRRLKFPAFVSLLFPITAVLGYALLMGVMWARHAQGILRGPEAVFVMFFGWLYLPTLVLFIYLPLFYCLGRVEKYWKTRNHAMNGKGL
jgi:hypothetical protein